MHRDVYEEHGPGGLVISHEYGHRSYWLDNIELQPCDQCGELLPEDGLSYEGLCSECKAVNDETKEDGE